MLSSRAGWALVLCALGCGHGGPPPTSAAAGTGLTEHEVSPRDADANVTQALAPHEAYLDAQRPRLGRLFLFLPGSYMRPEHYRDIARIAAHRGYHVLCLSYPDSPPVLHTCSGRAPSCFEEVRTEIVEGRDTSPLVSVGPSDSIVGRLVRALERLDALYPGEGWGAFLDGEQPRWSAIAVAGHSQGGGHAAFLAQAHEVARVVLFSAPADNVDGVPAPWLARPHATPSERYYGLVHADEDAHDVMVAEWRLLGLGGALADAVADAPAFAGSHQLQTRVHPRIVVLGDHGSTAYDRATPLGPDGAPLLEPAWSYLVGP